MVRLVLALYLEGSTDETFLGNIILRTTISVLAKYEQHSVNVVRIDAEKNKSVEVGDQRILYAARQLALRYNNQYDEQFTTYPVLVVHCDADYHNNEKALHDRYFPGYELVQQAEEFICKTLVPIIPVRMIESWMLAADHDVLRDVLQTDMKAQDLGLVSKVKQIESEPKPKEKLDQIIQRARGDRSRRRYQISRKDLYEPLGRRISLERLNDVPSYKQFVKDLTLALKNLKLIQ